MRILGAFLFIIIMCVLCFICIKIAYWMENVDKKVDKDSYGFEMDDYEVNRKIRVASIIIFFIVATIGLLILFFKH